MYTYKFDLNMQKLFYCASHRLSRSVKMGEWEKRIEEQNEHESSREKTDEEKKWAHI